LRIVPVKREIRILGWDDAPFSFKDEHTTLIGTVFRGGEWLDGVITARIEVDGLDSTRKMAEAVNSSPHKDQLRAMVLDGVTFGGFNVVDIDDLRRSTGIPVIAVARDEPDFAAIRKALERFKDGDKRWDIMRKAGAPEPMGVKNPKTGKIKKMWLQYSGVDPETAREIVRVSSTRSFVPEPLRVAHLIGSGIGCCK
jgi:endonuclease V-like protein UPF0215 family